MGKVTDGENLNNEDQLQSLDANLKGHLNPVAASCRRLVNSPRWPAAAPSLVLSCAPFSAPSSPFDPFSASRKNILVIELLARACANRPSLDIQTLKILGLDGKRLDRWWP